MYLYVLATWLIANLVHPFMMYVVFGGGDFDLDGFGMQFIFYSFVFSLPSLFLSFLAIYGISKLPASGAGKYIAWLITAPVIVFINYWLLFAVLFNLRIEKEEIDIMWPAIIAVVITIVVRYVSFFKNVAQLNKEKNETVNNTNGSY